MDDRTKMALWLADRFHKARMKENRFTDGEIAAACLILGEILDESEESKSNRITITASIEIQDVVIPEGYEVSRFGVPMAGEVFIEPETGHADIALEHFRKSRRLILSRSDDE